MGTSMNKKYGLPTALAMVVGIVIGSGIFFKADDILLLTDGNATLGVFGFLLVGIGVVFGAAIFAQFAIHDTSKEGGTVSYALNTHNESFGKHFGFIMGWFLTAIYLPCMLVILAYVCASYFMSLMNIEANSNTVMLFTALFAAAAYISNAFAPRFSGGVQSIATVLKLIPLAIIGVVGIFMSADASTVDAAVQSSGVVLVPENLDNMSNNFLGALIGIAFAFDAWYVATSITSELNNPKKFLPIALVGGTIMVTIIYVIYFYGVTNILDPEIIIQAGDDHVGLIGTIIFGEIGGKLLTLFVVISVYGGLNGITLSFFRMPHMLVSNNVMKDRFNIKKVNETFDMPFNSILFGIPFVLVVYILHYISVVDGTWFNEIGFDISTLPILIQYCLFVVLYTGIITMIRRGQVSKIYYLFFVIAVFISGLVIYGVFSLNITGVLYISIGVLVTIIGYLLFYNDEKEAK